MSDIHGHFNEFKRMLDKIRFSDEDELILAGDYIDRGPQSLEMLMWIERCPENVLLLKGNHEFEFAENVRIMTKYQKEYGITGNGYADTLSLHQKINWEIELKRASVHFDHYATIRILINECAVTIGELKRWADIFKELLLYHNLVVNGKKYIVVHHIPGSISDRDILGDL